MTERRSVFYDEWRDCLHSHYLYVLETGDNVTEPTLRHVLVEAGVPAEMVEDWRLEAADRFGLDWIKAEYEQAHATPVTETFAPVEEEVLEIPVIQELSTESIVDVIEIEPDLLEVILEDESEVAGEDTPELPPPPKPVTRSQLSLFGDK